MRFGAGVVQTMVMPLAPPLAAPVAVVASANDSPNGLTSDEARLRLEKSGPNSMPDTSSHPARRAIEKLWAPIPWMLEAAIVLEVVLGKYVEAGIIAVLLVFNAALGFFQEGRAQATLAALKKRLAMTASVRRDGAWKNLPAADLVPGDIVKLSLGGVVAADVQLIEGNVLLDQSMLTGESIGTEAGPGSKLLPGRWCAAARRSPESRRRESAPSSVARPSWFAPPMSSVRSKRPCCAWCAISRCSTAL